MIGDATANLCDKRKCAYRSWLKELGKPAIRERSHSLGDSCSTPVASR
jgi:hypothetical protein